MRQKRSVNIARVVFGRFPQNANDLEMTPISWLVVSEDEEKMILLSEKFLDFLPFNLNENMYSNEWETSYLRELFHNTYYPQMFSEEEKKQLIPCENTNDYITLPSKEELEAWMAKEDCGTPNIFFAQATDYAKAQSKQYGYPIQNLPNGFWLTKTPSKYTGTVTKKASQKRRRRGNYASSSHGVFTG